MYMTTIMYTSFAQAYHEGHAKLNLPAASQGEGERK
jgi:hypothetical protein